MSLSTFKSKLKIFSFLFLFALNALGFYLLGSFNLFEQIKGVKQTKSESTGNLEIPQDIPVPASDSQENKVIGSFVKLCANTVFGFEVSYPKDWITTYNEDSQKCLFFAPYSFVIPKDTTEFMTPIELEVVKSEDWEETTKFYKNPNDFQNIISVQTLDLNGQSIQKIIAETTNAGSLPSKYTKITYLVFNNKTSVVLTFQQLKGDENIKQYEEVVTQMAASVKIY